MSIGRKAASGVAWNMATGVTVRAFALIGTLILTHFIAPYEYGEVSAAAISVMTVTRLLTFGLGPYVIAHRSGPGEAFQAAAYHLAGVALGCVGVLLLREPLGAILGAPHMGRFVPGLALAALITGLAGIPSATLVRALRFRIVAISRALGEVSFTLVSIALAPAWSGAAIVAGSVARAAVASTLLVARASRAEWLHPTRPSWQTARSFLSFGLPVSGALLTETVASSWDNLLVSHLFGAKTMGQYNLAYNLADAPASHVAEHIGDVLLPSFATMDDAHRRRALLRSAALMALVIFPLAVGLGTVAPTLVETLFDPRWSEMAPMLTILSGISVMRCLAWVVNPYLQARHRTLTIMFLGLFKAAAVLGLILTMGRTSPLWACRGVLLAFTLHAAASLLVVHRTEGINAIAVLRAVTPPLVACALLASAVLLTRHLLLQVGVLPGWFRLLAEVGVGMVAYLGTAPLIARSPTQDLMALLRQLWQASIGSPAPSDGTEPA